MNIKDIFKTKDGEIVVGQVPNKPLIIAIFLYVLRYFPGTEIFIISEWSFSLTMLYWAYLEISSGVNLFRRLLGSVVFAYFIYRIYLLF